MPHNFAETPTGMVLIASGMDPVLRWDGLTGTAETAGVDAPINALVLSGSGSGAIAGKYTAYLRFVDRLGNFSNLSPVSNEYEAKGASGLITDATNAVPIVITSTAHGLQTGTFVRISGVQGNTAANNLWKITVLDLNRFSLQDPNLLSDSVGNESYRGGGTWTSGVLTVSYSSVQAPFDGKVTRRQILRNTHGQKRTYYVDIDTTDVLSSVLTSTKSDADLTLGVAVALLATDDTDLAISRYTPPRDDRTILAYHLGRAFAAGVEPYAEGAVAVTFGSATVTGINTEWPVVLKNRSLYVLGEDQSYTIKSVDRPAQTLTLTTPYEGPTDAFANYVIWPAIGTRRTIFYSERDLPEAWPPTNSLSLQEDGDEITGLMPKGSFLYILERRHVYRFTYQNNPAKDGFVFLSSWRGCINNRCWAIVEDVAYMLDESGIHAFAGNDTEPISPAIQNLFEPEGPAQDDELRINWSVSRYFHVVHQPGSEVIRWFVAMSGSYLPRHALCYNLRYRRWWLEEYPVPIGCSALGRLGGRPQVFLGTFGRRVIALASDLLDGPEASSGVGTLRGTVSSATLTSLTDTTASFPGSGLVASPVSIVAGRGKGQRRTIASATSTVLRISQPWAITPDSTSVYQIGGIEWTYKTGTFRILGEEEGEEEEIKRRVELLFQPVTKQATADLRIFFNLSASPRVAGRSRRSLEADGLAATVDDPDLVVDLTRSIGFVQHRMDAARELYSDGDRFLSLELRGVANQERVQVYQIAIDGVKP